MKKLTAPLLLSFLTLIFSRPGLAFDAKKKAGVEVLLLDAIMSLASSGAAIGARAAAIEVKPGYDRAVISSVNQNEDTRYVNRVAHFANIAAGHFIGGPRSDGHSINALDMVSREVGLPIYGHTSGDEIARSAAISAGKLATATSTWGPDLIIAVSTEAARLAIKQGATEEEIGRAAANAAWIWILNNALKIRKAVETKLRFCPAPISDAGICASLVKTDYDSNKLIFLLNKSMNWESFNFLEPKAQNFYRESVDKVRSLLE